MASVEPEGPQGSKSTRPKRNAQNYRPSGRSIPDLINDPITPSQVTDELSARAELEKRFLLTPTAEITIDTLTTALLDFTIQTPSISVLSVEILRAIAILLFKADHDKKAKLIAASVTTLLEETISRFEGSMKEKEDSMEIEKANLISTTARAEDAADAICSGTKEIKGIIDILTPSLDSVQSQLNSLATKITVTSAASNTSEPTIPKSYSAAVKQSSYPPAPVSAALIRAATKERQVLFDPTPGNTLFTPESTPNEIAKVLQTAFQSTRKEDSPEVTVKAAQRLRNGGILVELTTAEAAMWIRTPEIRLEILKALNMPANIKNRTFPIIVPFVPITTPIEDVNWIRTVEEENSLSLGAIDSIKWIKPKERRTPEQRFAHTMFHFTTAEAANISLRDGIYINKEKLHPRKDKREPVRCVRCQIWGHVAKDCKAPKDICGTCGKNHRTPECSAYKTYYCVSCNSHDHASWNRDCPEFENRCAKIDAKLPENSMPYYPTNEDWTQVMLPPKPEPYIRKPTTNDTRPDSNRPRYHQTNLEVYRHPNTQQQPRRQQRGFSPSGANSIQLPARPSQRPRSPNPASDTTITWDYVVPSRASQSQRQNINFNAPPDLPRQTEPTRPTPPTNV